MKKQKITKRDIELYNTIPKWVEENNKFIKSLPSNTLFIELLRIAPLMIMACAVLLYIIQ